MIMAMSPEPIDPKPSPKSGLIARDARVYGGETKDFVDWIRTTGPTSEQQVQPIVLSHRLSQASSLNLLGATGNMTPPNRVTSPPPQKSNMVAREADVRNETNDDLLDFLRDGPPGESGPPVTKSAFRAPVIKAAGKNSVLPKSAMVDSFKSNGPLPNSNKPLPNNNNNGAPTRTRRRPKDIYAIDSDSDEDDFMGISNRNPRSTGNEMENLQDFLRSTSPPVSNGFASGRNGSSQALNGPQANGVGRSNSITNAAASEPALLNGSLTNKKSNPALSAIGRISGNKRQEARAAGATKNFNGRGYHYSTNDMADFLRTSGPDAMNGAPRATAPVPFRAASPEVNGKGSKRGRAFWKRGVEAGA
jgi:hypothetical protein